MAGGPDEKAFHRDDEYVSALIEGERLSDVARHNAEGGETFNLVADNTLDTVLSGRPNCALAVFQERAYAFVIEANRVADTHGPPGRAGESRRDRPFRSRGRRCARRAEKRSRVDPRCAASLASTLMLVKRNPSKRTIPPPVPSSNSPLGSWTMVRTLSCGRPSSTCQTCF